MLIEVLNMQYLIFSTSPLDCAKCYECLNIRTAPFPCVPQSLLLRNIVDAADEWTLSCTGGNISHRSLARFGFFPYLCA